jgi:hypothetical protein
MTTIINAVSGTGLSMAGDGSGIIKLQSNSVTTNALAWVNFDGTASTPITPRANYNISSITKNATGDYTLNFTVSLSDANYVVIGATLVDSASTSASSWFAGLRATSGVPITKTTSAARVSTTTQTAASYSSSETSFAVFGN